MNRRTFVAGTGAVVLAAPLTAEAQQAGKVYKIGASAPSPGRLQVRLAFWPSNLFN
jgi:hypothetical protein